MAPRSTLSLDGTWTFAPDPRNEGQTQGWHARTGFERSVAVPSPWQLYGPDMVGYTGYAWYHRAFEVPADWAGREIALRFDAVDYEAKVWLNGKLLGTHEGGYTPFEFVIAPESGTNHLVMRVFDPKDNSEIPHGKQGSWYTRVSGPWQPVTLEARDAIHVSRVHVTPLPQEARAKIRVSAQAPDGQAVSVRLVDPDGAEVAVLAGTIANGEAALTHAFEEDIALWSPDSPALYTAEVTVGADTRTVAFGMRWVEVKEGLFFLNGEPLYMRGALDQAFYPETVYRVPDTAYIENEIRLAKEMGLNLLRKHIKLEDPRYLDACDRLGMLIWEEPACFAKYTPQAKARFKAEIEAMIDRDFNHPSIIAWSLYNEEWGLEWRLWRDTEKQEHVEGLYDYAKTLDPTRPFCDNSGWAHVKTDINDWHRYFTAPDLVPEWKADLSHCVDKPETNFVAGKQDNAKDIPVVISEFGVWGLPEVSRITDYYQGTPWWFEAQWAGHTEEFKYPATALRHFERYGLDRVFGDLDGLGAACQRRMMRALKPIIEEMRRRPNLAGYVVTEFTDIEWESNGWLDYFRRPKAGFNEFAWFNAPLVVGLELARHNAWVREDIEATVWYSNHTPEAYEATLRWRIAGHDGHEGELSVSIKPFTSGPLKYGPHLRIEAPEVTAPAKATLEIELVYDGRVLATNAEELTITPWDSTAVAASGPVTLRGDAQALEAGLLEAGFQLEETLGANVLLVTTTLDAEARAHLEAGGRALMIAEHGEQAPEKGSLSFRRLPRGESWDRAASILYIQPGVFGDLPVGGVMGWECEDLFPHHVVPLSNYLQDFGGRGIELPSNQADVDPAGVLAGYFEGWVGKFGAAILRLPYENGQLTVTTLRLIENYGLQPIGTAMVHRLVALCATEVATTT
ncbi:Beta-glucuronidase [compost metagenome]